MRKRILFVDGDPKTLKRLESTLDVLGTEWDLVFTHDGAAALRMLAQVPCDVVVTGVRAGGMRGAELLGAVAQRHPDAVRILRFDQSEEEDFLRSVSSAHQFLSDYSEPGLVVEAIERAFWIRDLLKDRGLARVIGGVRTLPSLPSLYLRIMEELRSKEPALGKIARIIASDVSMSTKTLQLVNSVIYGVRVKINDPVRAAVYLGLNMIKGLALSAEVFSTLEDYPSATRSMGDLWEHSMKVGLIAQKIFLSEGLGRDAADDAFMAGMLHDVGKVVLIANLREPTMQALAQARREQVSLFETEREILGATHAEVGAYLIGLWGLSFPLVESILCHHDPRRAPGGGLTTALAVHVADAIEHERSGSDVRAPLDEACVEEARLLPRLDHWKTIIPQE